MANGIKNRETSTTSLNIWIDFSDKLWCTGANIVKHPLIMFAWPISHFIPPKIILMYSYSDQIFDALLCLHIFVNPNILPFGIAHSLFHQYVLGLYLLQNA